MYYSFAKFVGAKIHFFLIQKMFLENIFLLIDSFAKNGTPNPYHRASFFNGNRVIVGHAARDFSKGFFISKVFVFQ